MIFTIFDTLAPVPEFVNTYLEFFLYFFKNSLEHDNQDTNTGMGRYRRFDPILGLCYSETTVERLMMVQGGFAEAARGIISGEVTSAVLIKAAVVYTAGESG